MWLLQVATLSSLLARHVVESVVGGVVMVVREFGFGVALGSQVKHEQEADDGGEDDSSR